MLAKAAIIVVLLVIVYLLVSAFWFLFRDQGRGRRTVRRLSWRIGMALALFVFLYAAFLMGWLHPSGPNPVNYPAVVTEPVTEP